MRKLLTFFILTLLATTATRAATVTDELTYQGIGVSGTNYSDWSGISFTSGAVYAGNSAGGNNAIQLRSNNSNSGIVTTASGGKVKKITVEWNSNTTNERTLNVYGKNTAYSAASDLYNTSNQGTLLGTIVEGTTTELTVKGDYQYIGFRSAWGALYLEKVSIEWEEGESSTTTSVFELVTDVTNLVSGDDIIVVAVDNIHAMGAVDNKVGGSATGFTLSGTQVTLDANTDVVVYNLSLSNGFWALSNSNISIGASGADLNNFGEAKWTITITDGVAKLVYNNESNRQLAYRLEGTTYNYFKHYASSNIDDKYYFNVKIYKRQTSSPSPDYPEVVGIAAFKQVEAGTTVKLKLTDESNARVLHVENGTGGAVDAYVRDNTGAIVLKGIKPNRTMAYNQHLAGWIVGQHEVEASTGLPQLIPVADTNTDELVIAEPVTEAVTLPVEIEMSDMDEKLADWATVRNVRMGGNGVPEITDAFGASGYTAPYQGALVDVTGIVTNGKIYPMTEDAGYPLVTYVLDATQEFTSPATTVANVPLRWQRRFFAGQWTPVTVPFAIDEFDGTVMRYTSLSDGGTTTTASGSYATGQMNFSEVTSIEPGVPYLVKPRDGYNSMSFDNVTITTTAPATLSYTTRGAVSGGSGAPARAIAVDDTYSMVGTYSPMTVEEDNSNKLIVGGDVVWAGNGNGNTVEGSSAYLNTPKNQAIKLNMGDGVIITGIDIIEATETAARTGIYNLLGMKLPGDWESLPPGIYIVNGKKMVKQ